MSPPKDSYLFDILHAIERIAVYAIRPGQANHCILVYLAACSSAARAVVVWSGCDNYDTFFASDVMSSKRVPAADR